ncbi:hypothetical protein [Sciscionella marina]|uniref:hypothetical protein n=1 Tax=Sciscionella marina TaxID=508770 RepID=UPI001F09EDDA|nr:hypothetical protein [Sciscionella marina]
MLVVLCCCTRDQLVWIPVQRAIIDSLEGPIDPSDFGVLHRHDVVVLDQEDGRQVLSRTACSVGFAGELLRQFLSALAQQPSPIPDDDAMSWPGMRSWRRPPG